MLKKRQRESSQAREEQQCTPWCQGCKRQHHYVLLNLVDICDEDSFNKFRRRLTFFTMEGFDLNDELPDDNPAYSYSVLHWAAVLGDTRVVKLLLKAPHSLNPSRISKTSGDTALHRTLSYFIDQEGTGKQTQERCMDLISLLHACLPVADARGNSPLHACSNYLASCIKSEIPFWQGLLEHMVRVLSQRFYDWDARQALNTPSADGDTVLHMLVTRWENSWMIEMLMLNGADVNTRNKKGETPLDTAWRCSVQCHTELSSLYFPQKLLESQIPLAAASKRANSVSNTADDAKHEDDKQQDVSRRGRSRDQASMKLIRFREPRSCIKQINYAELSGSDSEEKGGSDEKIAYNSKPVRAPENPTPATTDNSTDNSADKSADNSASGRAFIHSPHPKKRLNSHQHGTDKLKALNNAFMADECVSFDEDGGAGRLQDEKRTKLDKDDLSFIRPPSPSPNVSSAESSSSSEFKVPLESSSQSKETMEFKVPSPASAKQVFRERQARTFTTAWLGDKRNAFDLYSPDEIPEVDLPVDNLAPEEQVVGEVVQDVAEQMDVDPTTGTEAEITIDPNGCVYLDENGSLLGLYDGDCMVAVNGSLSATYPAANDTILEASCCVDGLALDASCMGEINESCMGEINASCAGDGYIHFDVSCAEEIETSVAEIDEEASAMAQAPEEESMMVEEEVEMKNAEGPCKTEHKSAASGTVDCPASATVDPADNSANKQQTSVVSANPCDRMERANHPSNQMSQEQFMAAVGLVSAQPANKQNEESNKSTPGLLLHPRDRLLVKQPCKQSIPASTASKASTADPVQVPASGADKKRLNSNQWRPSTKFDAAISEIFMPPFNKHKSPKTAATNNSPSPAASSGSGKTNKTSSGPGSQVTELKQPGDAPTPVHPRRRLQMPSLTSNSNAANAASDRSAASNTNAATNASDANASSDGNAAMSRSPGQHSAKKIRQSSPPRLHTSPPRLGILDKLNSIPPRKDHMNKILQKTAIRHQMVKHQSQKLRLARRMKQAKKDGADPNPKGYSRSPNEQQTTSVHVHQTTPHPKHRIPVIKLGQKKKLQPSQLLKKRAKLMYENNFIGHRLGLLAEELERTPDKDEEEPEEDGVDAPEDDVAMEIVPAGEDVSPSSAVGQQKSAPAALHPRNRLLVARNKIESAKTSKSAHIPKRRDTSEDTTTEEPAKSNGKLDDIAALNAMIEKRRVDMENQHRQEKQKLEMIQQRCKEAYEKLKAAEQATSPNKPGQQHAEREHDQTQDHKLESPVQQSAASPAVAVAEESPRLTQAIRREIEEKMAKRKRELTKGLQSASAKMQKMEIGTIEEPESSKDGKPEQQSSSSVQQQESPQNMQTLTRRMRRTSLETMNNDDDEDNKIAEDAGIAMNDNSGKGEPQQETAANADDITETAPDADESLTDITEFQLETISGVTRSSVTPSRKELVVRYLSTLQPRQRLHFAQFFKKLALSGGEPAAELKPEMRTPLTKNTDATNACNEPLAFPASPSPISNKMALPSTESPAKEANRNPKPNLPGSQLKPNNIVTAAAVPSALTRYQQALLTTGSPGPVMMMPVQTSPKQLPVFPVQLAGFPVPNQQAYPYPYFPLQCIPAHASKQLPTLQPKPAPLPKAASMMAVPGYPNRFPIPAAARLLPQSPQGAIPAVTAVPMPSQLYQQMMMAQQGQQQQLYAAATNMEDGHKSVTMSASKQPMARPQLVNLQHARDTDMLLNRTL